MPALSFLNPLFLLGLSSISIPIILHLIHRKRARPLRFSAVKFILLTQKRLARRLRLKQLLLLLLRILILVLLALALARPLLRTRPAFSLAQDTASSTVIILDNSYSMGYMAVSRSWFEMAQEVASRIVDLFQGSGDGALILMSDRPQPVVPHLTSHFSLIKEEIKKAPLSYGTSHVLSSLSQAYSIFKDSINANKQIFLITDLTKNGWQGLEQEVGEHFDLGVRLYIVDVSGREGAGNLALGGGGGPEEFVTLGSQIKIGVQFFNHSGNRARNLLCQLFIDDEKVDQRLVNIEPRKSLREDFIYTPSRPGAYSGYVQIARDGLVADNRYFFQFEVGEAVRVLVIDGEPSPTAFRSETFFLEYALNPRIMQAELAIKSTLVVIDELKDYDFKDFDVVILCNLKTLPKERRKELSLFVRKGGGLLISLGNNVDPVNYNEDLFSPPIHLLPVSLKKVEGVANNEQERLRLEDFSHPILQIFQDPKQGDLSSALFSKFFATEVEALPSSTKILLRYTNGLPALLERELGQGRVLLFTSTIDREWNNLSTKTVFLPLIQQMVYYLGHKLKEERKGEGLVGEPIRYRLPLSLLNETLRIINPLGEPKAIRLTGGEDFVEAVYSDTEIPGIYSMKFKEKREYFVINLDLRESDLSRIEPSAIREKFKDIPLAIILDTTNLEEKILNLSRGVEIWKLLLMGMMGLLLIEGFLASRW